MCRRPLTRILTCVVLASLAMLLLLSPARCQESPENYKVGIYVTSIHTIDAAAGTYAADLWIWSVGTSPTRDPLKTMEFVNSAGVTWRLESTTRRGDLYWRQAKVVGTFRQAWDLQQFPFDRQVLVLTVEEGIDNSSILTYGADVANTGYLPDASPQGWRITGQKVVAGITQYATGFGDPAGGKGSNYAKLQVMITLQRASVATFVNLAAPLYAAFLLCAVSFLRHNEGHAMVESRIALLAGALFAVVLNIRAVSNVLGNEYHMTIVDRLNILVLVYIVFGTFVTISAGIRHKRGQAVLAACRLCLQRRGYPVVRRHQHVPACQSGLKASRSPGYSASSSLLSVGFQTLEGVFRQQEGDHSQDADR